MLIDWIARTSAGRVLLMHLLDGDDPAAWGIEVSQSDRLATEELMAATKRVVAIAVALVLSMTSRPLVSSGYVPPEQPIVLRHDRWVRLTLTNLGDSGAHRSIDEVDMPPLALVYEAAIGDFSRLLLDHGLAGPRP